MTIKTFFYQLIQSTHWQWQKILENALESMDENYLKQIHQTTDWLPGFKDLFAAFNHSLNNTQYVLLGESPYPRPQSANGYAFWDNAVRNIWSEKGLSKEVNRATSLRNFIKMLLIARGDLNEDLSQRAIATLDKSVYWQTAEQLFLALMRKGFLLLNASLIYEEHEVPFHAKHWQPFMNSIFKQLLILKHPVKFIVFGRIASKIPYIHDFPSLCAEHPYNLSFIRNLNVQAFFKPLDVLSCHD